MTVEPACDGTAPVLRQTMTVTALAPGEVTLEAHRASGCAACAARAGCGAGALAEMLGGRSTLRLPTALPLAPGDRVTVAMDRGAFLGAALRAYLLPPAALVLAAGGASVAGLSDAVTALICLPALALGFVPLLRADRRGLRGGSLWIEGPADA